MSVFHDKYMIVYSNKADNNIAFVCKSHYVDCLINELGIDNSLGNPTYTPTTLPKGEIPTIIGLLYIPLHFQSKKKNWIYRLSTGFILPNGSRKLLPNHQRTMYILSVVKTGLQSYCDTSYSRGGVNRVWILKNSKDMLECI